MKLGHGWLGIVLSFCVFSTAHSAPGEFCARTRDILLGDFEAPSNRIGFKNNGGLFDGGVCWWHSRLQRSAVYLAQYAPGLPKPSQSAARALIEHLIHMDRVITIPGFSDFNGFSKAHEALIQKELNEWQIRDGFLYQQWVRGLYGRPALPAAVLRERLDRIFVTFKKSKPGLWVMAQFPGITSHALLFIGMERTPTGFDFRVIDSNRPETTREIHYQYGDRSLALGKEGFTPFVGFQTDQHEIDEAIGRYCSR